MPDERIDALFDVPPAVFVERRDELVRALRSEKRREEAKQVAALRRPTLAAWAVNRAVRTRPEEYAALREAGDALRRAMRRAVSGAGGADVRGATRARRERIAALTDHAVALLGEAGADATGHRDEIVATFDAASADPEAGERIAAARLSRPEPAPSGFGDLAPLSVMERDVAEEPGTGDDAGATSAREPDPQAERRRALRAAVEEARRVSQAASTDALRLEAEAERARQAASAARDEAERARRVAESAQRDAEHRVREAQRRTDEAQESRRVADRRARELREVEQELEDVGG